MRSFTVDAGVDVVSFGGTKNGMMYGEAVVFLTPELARRREIIRKQVSQLPSKMRYIAAQFTRCCADDLWLRNAAHANAMAAAPARRGARSPGVDLDGRPAVNSLFPRLPGRRSSRCRPGRTFYDWDTAIHQVRWMTSFDTTVEDVARFAAGVRALLS